MLGWRLTIVLVSFLVLLNFWTCILIFLPNWGSLLYTSYILRLRPSALSIEVFIKFRNKNFASLSKTLDLVIYS
jgi:hypothetical protein